MLYFETFYFLLSLPSFESALTFEKCVRSIGKRGGVKRGHVRRGSELSVKLPPSSPSASSVCYPA